MSKRIRDETRESNKDLKLKQGFTANPKLINDYEQRKNAIESKLNIHLLTHLLTYLFI